MQRSKLELYEEVLAALSPKPQSIDEVAYHSKMDCVLLSQRLEFLIKHNLVEEKTANKKRLYTITRRGTTIYKTLIVVKQLEKLQTSTHKTPKYNLFHLIPFQNSENEKTNSA